MTVYENIFTLLLLKDMYTLFYFYLYFYYTKRLRLRCIHHFKSDLINNMDRIRISCTENSSVIIQSNFFFKVKKLSLKVPEQAKSKRNVINPQNDNFIPFLILDLNISILILLPQLTVRSRSAIVVQSKVKLRFCVVTLLFEFFCRCRGFCQRTESFPFSLSIMLSKRCESIKIDSRTWLHVPSWTILSTSIFSRN